MLRKEKLQIVEEKMKQRRFLASALLIISPSCILRNTMVKTVYCITGLFEQSYWLQYNCCGFECSEQKAWKWNMCKSEL